MRGGVADRNEPRQPAEKERGWPDGGRSCPTPCRAIAEATSASPNSVRSPDDDIAISPTATISTTPPPLQRVSAVPCHDWPGAGLIVSNAARTRTYAIYACILPATPAIRGRRDQIDAGVCVCVSYASWRGTAGKGKEGSRDGGGREGPKGGAGDCRGPSSFVCRGNRRHGVGTAPLDAVRNPQWRRRRRVIAPVP